MKKIALSILILIAHSLISSGYETNELLPKPVEITHYENNGQHILVIPNLLTIPEENYNKLIYRMVSMYPEIKEIKYHKSQEQFSFLFQANLPPTIKLNEILSKFSIFQYSVLKA